MAPPEPPQSIKLRIKVPPGHIEGGVDEYALSSDIPVATSVGQIRRRIQQEVHTNPAPEKQRLLYGGRALVDDEQTLADALNTKRDPTQDEYVIHLLIKGDGSNTAPSSHARGSSMPGSSGSPAQANAPQGPPHLPQPPPMPNQLHAGHLPPRIHPQHLLHHQAALQAQQQRLQAAHAQMLQNGGQHGFLHQGVGLMPFGMQHPNLAGQVPQPQGIPTQGQAFQQAVANGQQNRAAMGMHGVGERGAGLGQQPDPNTSTSPAPTGPSLSPNPAPNTQPPTQAQSPPNAGVHQHGPPLRPISDHGYHVEVTDANGQRYTVHQQTMNFAQAPLTSQVPHGLPGFGLPHPMHQPSNVRTPSALDTARENIAEMRRMLNELRDGSAVTDDQRARIARLDESTQALNRYIDPFGVGNASGNSPIPTGNVPGAARQTPSPQPPNLSQHPIFQPPHLRNGAQPSTIAAVDNMHRGLSTAIQNAEDRIRAFQNATEPPQQMQGAAPILRDALSSFQQHLRNSHGAPMPTQPVASLRDASSGSNDVTCYLINSADGPEAIIYSPQHGQYTGRLPYATATAVLPTSASHATTPTPTPTQAADNNGPAADAQAQPGQGQVAVQAQGQAPPAARAQAARPAQPNMVNHFWMLFRLLVFAYFFLGSNFGWQRPLILLVLGVGFYVVRNGRLLADGAMLRRWWDDVVGVPRAQNQAAQAGDGAQAARPGQMPTPEQVAQRMMDEQRRARWAGWAWMRDAVRPVERTIALLVASLWPGVGEAHVRAQEAEERRVTEELAAREGRKEEERVKREEEKSRVEDGGEEKVEKESTEASGSTNDDREAKTDVVESEKTAAGPA